MNQFPSSDNGHGCAKTRGGTLVPSSLFFVHSGTAQRERAYHSYHTVSVAVVSIGSMQMQHPKSSWPATYSHNYGIQRQSRASTMMIALNLNHNRRVSGVLKLSVPLPTQHHLTTPLALPFRSLFSCFESSGPIRYSFRSRILRAKLRESVCLRQLQPSSLAVPSF